MRVTYYKEIKTARPGVNLPSFKGSKRTTYPERDQQVQGNQDTRPRVSAGEQHPASLQAKNSCKPYIYIYI